MQGCWQGPVPGAFHDATGHFCWLMDRLRHRRFAGTVIAMTPLDAHNFDEDGEHDPDECELCFERAESVSCECRCGHCCERLILEASLRDGEREARIAAECRPIKDIGPDIVGYLLNDKQNGNACHFFNRATLECAIYETRPLMCRVFNCDQERVSAELGHILCHEKEAPRDEAKD